MGWGALFRQRRGTASEEHWVPLSDLMTGLMMVFMLIAVLFMVKTEEESKKVQESARQVKEIAVLYDQMRVALYEDLREEFRDDLSSWGAEVDQDLTVRFKEPDVLFDTGKDTLKPRFTAILDNFFPRYVRIVAGPEYRDSIEEVRIEGHTSSFWNSSTSVGDAYFLNMALSQSRTRSALRYVLGIPGVAVMRGWLESRLTANGVSSSRLIHRADGTEDRNGSQRVEFRVRTNANERLAEILTKQ